MYAITAAGRRALRKWLDEPPAPPQLEFEAMVKVFFADAGTLDQLRHTLEEVETNARERRAQLQSQIDAAAEGPYEFTSRLATNALGLRFHLDHEELIASWAAWARHQISTWNSPTDAGDWGWLEALA
jgi:hypothetical protein